MKTLSNKKAWGIAALWVLAGIVTAAFASGAQDIGGLAANVQKSLGPIESMIIAVCYIGGVAFAGAAIMKFKAHKDAPQQTTLGQPIALLFIAAALIWMPQIVKTTGQTVFGTTTGQGGTTGSETIFE